MTPVQQPTAYWVIRDCDGVAFTLLAAHQHETAVEKAQDYEEEFDEPFTVQEEHRVEISYWDLPETWTENDDWNHRVPYSIRVTDVPSFALPGTPNQ